MKTSAQPFPLALCLVLSAACGDDDGGDTQGSGSATAASTASPTTSPTTTAPTTTAGNTGSSGAAATSSTGPADSTDAADTSGSSGETSSGTPKSLMFIVDGLRSDALLAATTPNFDALVDGTWQPGYSGAYTGAAQCLTDAASNSGPNHWAIMTGAVGAQHGVTGNGDVATGDDENFPHYLSLLERDDDTRNTVYLFTWFTDIQIPCEADYILHGDDASNSQRAAQIVAQTYEDASGHLETSWAAGTDPDAIFLFVDDVDGAGHGNGFSPEVPGYLAQIEEVDGQLGGILDAIAARPGFAEESWQIVITTDHGGLGTSHGGDSTEELTIPFIVAGRDVAPGGLPAATEAGGTRNFDTVPTVLEHFGVAVPEALTGASRAGGG